MDKSTEKLIKKIAPGALAAFQETSSALIARADELRSELRERYPDYESLLAAAAGHISASRDRELMIRSTINFPGLSLEDKLTFIEALHPDSAAVLKNTLKTKTAAAGAKGGQKRSARYQAIESEVIAAYLEDDAAQAAKTIDSATYKLRINRPDLCEKVGDRTMRNLISKLRKNAE